MKVIGTIDPVDSIVSATTTDGRVCQGQAVQGRWELELSPDLYQWEFSNPTCKILRKVARISGPGDTADFGDTQLEPAGPGLQKCTVQLKDDLGKPVIGAQIQVFRFDSEVIVEAGTTDKSGYWECFLDLSVAHDAFVYKAGHVHPDGSDRPVIFRWGG